MWKERKERMLIARLRLVGLQIPISYPPFNNQYLSEKNLNHNGINLRMKYNTQQRTSFHFKYVVRNFLTMVKTATKSVKVLIQNR